jgi:hypothetical protein
MSTQKTLSLQRSPTILVREWWGEDHVVKSNGFSQKMDEPLEECEK